MSTNTLSIALDSSNKLVRHSRSAILLCTLALGACAGLPAAEATPETKVASHPVSEGFAAGPIGQPLARVWWKLYAW